MAKRGRKPSKNRGTRAKAKAKTKTMDKNIAVVVIIMISILLGVLIYGKAGYIGEHLSVILGGIFGWIKLIIPVGTFGIAIAYACDKKELLSSKIFQYIIFLLCICVILSVSQITKEMLDITKPISEVLSSAYEL